MRLWPSHWRPSLFRHRPRGRDLGRDLGAGVVLTGLLVPAGMGYAEVAGLPAVTGLYATVLSLAAYAAVGPSRILILGPDSSLAPIIAAGIAPLALAGSDRAVALAGVLALLSGAILLLGGVLRLGLLTDLLSRPIQVGYLNGVAATLVVSQLPKLFGFGVESDDIVGIAADFAEGVTDGRTVPEALFLGASSLAVILLLRRVAPNAPGLLGAVAGATLVVWVADWEQVVNVVGPLPGGLPTPALAGVSWSDVGSLAPVAFGVALIASADTTLLTRSLGTADDATDESHEMAALGVANAACGAFGGFPVSASSSRTPVAISSGSTSQITGLVGGALVLVLLALLPSATSLLPSAALGAVVIAAATSLADPRQLWALWSMRREEFVLAAVTFLGVALIGVLRAIALAVLLSLAVFVIRAWRPHQAELVRVRGRKGYHDAARHPEGDRVPGLVIARFDAPLFFANARVFTKFVDDLVERATPAASWVLVAAEPITDIDTTAAQALTALDDRLARHGITLAFAELKGPVRDRLRDYGVLEHIEADRFFPTLGTAVSGYLRATGAEWTDWTDEPDSDAGL